MQIAAVSPIFADLGIFIASDIRFPCEGRSAATASDTLRLSHFLFQHEWKSSAAQSGTVVLNL
jgi:hypothetical protein